jgi:hypothetical protein
MTKYKNPRELEEMEEFEREELDRKVIDPVEPKETVKEDTTDWKARYAELRRHQQQEKDRLLNENLTLKRQLEGIQSGTIKPPKSQEEISEWKETYPEFADVLDTWIKEAVAEQTADLRRQNAQSEKEKALLRLKEKHPDCEAIFIDQEFHEWMKEQPKLARDTIYKSFDVKGASFILDRYKAETGKSKKAGGASDDFDDVSAARAVKTRTAPSISEDTSRDYEFSESQIERESERNPKWWDANEEKILSAHRRGKILLDLSGGARN